MKRRESFLVRILGLIGISCLLVGGMLSLTADQLMAATVKVDDTTQTQGDPDNPAISTTSPGSLLGPETAGSYPSNIIGGYRHLYLQQTGNDSTDKTAIYVDGSSDPNVRKISMENGDEATGWFKVVYNGNSDHTQFSLGQDFTNLSYFNFAYVSADHTTILHIDVFTTAGNGYGAIVNPMPNTTNLKIYKADFTTTYGAGATWGNINRIEIYVDAVQALDTGIRNITAELEAPNIDCVSKRCTLNADWSGLTSTINLPQGQSFPVTLYCQFSVTNAGDGNDTVIIRDELPANMQLGSVVPDVQTPVGFNLGNASTTGPGPVTINWSSTDELKAASGLNDLVFRYTITVTSFEGSRINQFWARGASESEFGQGCPFTLLYSPQRVPSLNEWGMIILSLVLAASAVWLVRRRRTS